MKINNLESLSAAEIRKVVDDRIIAQIGRASCRERV